MLINKDIYYNRIKSDQSKSAGLELAWGINPDKIGIVGFSAGGHLASTLSTHFDEKVYEHGDSISARPDFSLLINPLVSMEEAITHSDPRVNLLGGNPSSGQVEHFSNELQVNGQTPPAFLAHSMDDEIVPVQNNIGYDMALGKNHIPCELHIYQSGGHGSVGKLRVFIVRDLPYMARS